MQNLTVGLIGNPNCGKTTLFNALTSSRQRVGNWPGVTVERKSGYFVEDDKQIEVVDLPGIYSLSIFSEKDAIDEKIAAEYILSDQADLIVNVVDANNFERNFYLTSQLLELDVPVVLAINMVDIAKKRGIKLDLDLLKKQTGCKVVPIVSKKNLGVDELKKTIVSFCNNLEDGGSISADTLHRFRGFKNKLINYHSQLSVALSLLTQQITATVGKNRHSYFLAVRLLEGDVLAKNLLPQKIMEIAKEKEQKVERVLKEDVDVLIADARYGSIHELATKTLKKNDATRKTFTSIIDKVVLNRILGIPIFFAVMYLMFLFTIGVGGRLQNVFQWAGDSVFVKGLHILSIKIGAPIWLSNAFVDGLGKGVSTTLTFIPVIAAMFFFLAILEGSGYMARAGFVVDRLMQSIGLPGKSFVPMLIGFGCNVPAVMAARTLRNSNERILTIMMTPFMSCGARLAVYAIFTAAFFPKGGQNIVFLLYFIGILVAIISGILFRKTILKGGGASLVAELPPYHSPAIREICLQTWCRLKNFILKAGKIIIPVCLIISMLNSFSFNGFTHEKYAKKDTVLSNIGKTITPIFKPIGIDQQNWPATVGLLTGVMAKEVVVGTLNTLYAAPRSKGLSDKIVYKKDVYGNMCKKFNSSLAAFAYLLFVLLYFPCVPTLVSIFRELNWRWALFSMIWNTGIAYLVATAFYQVAKLLI